MRDNVERWLIHESLPFDQVKSEENSFQILVKHAGQYGISVDIFEPKSQLGILVIGAKIEMKNNQIIRYRGFNEEERTKFANKVSGNHNAIPGKIYINTIANITIPKNGIIPLKISKSSTFFV